MSSPSLFKASLIPIMDLRNIYFVHYKEVSPLGTSSIGKPYLGHQSLSILWVPLSSSISEVMGKCPSFGGFTDYREPRDRSMTMMDLSVIYIIVMGTHYQS